MLLRVLLSFSSALYSLGFNKAVFLIKTVWKLEDSSRRGCSDTRILFLFKIFFIHISHVPFFNPTCMLETFFLELLV